MSFLDASPFIFDLTLLALKLFRIFWLSCCYRFRLLILEKEDCEYDIWFKLFLCEEGMRETYRNSVAVSLIGRARRGTLCTVALEFSYRQPDFWLSLRASYCCLTKSTNKSF